MRRAVRNPHGTFFDLNNILPKILPLTRFHSHSSPVLHFLSSEIGGDVSHRTSLVPPALLHTFHCDERPQSPNRFFLKQTPEPLYVALLAFCLIKRRGAFFLWGFRLRFLLILMVPSTMRIPIFLDHWFFSWA